MNKKFYILSFIALVLVITWCCKKPTQDFVINISSNIINYKTTFQFVDAQTGAVPTGITVAMDGDNAASIYDYSGLKQLQVSRDGFLTVGVDPKDNPTGNILSFNIKSNATNYLAVNTPVTVAATEKNQSYVVSMININNPPAGVKTVQPTATISAGTVTTPVTATTTPDATTTTSVSVTVPNGTQLRDANNAIINGTSVKVVAAAFDPAQQKAMQSLPGGQVQHDVIGGTASEVFFLPAGFATINMTVGSTEVRNFSAPVTVQIGLNANTFNPGTNALIKAGDNLNIYSYQVQTGDWTFERTVAVTASGGRLFASFTTTHLTTFAACVPPGNLRPCSSAPYIVFNAPGIDAASSDLFIVDIYPTGVGNNPPPIYSQYFAIHDRDSLKLTALPTGNLTINVSRVDYDHYLLSDYRNRGTAVANATVNICGSTGATPININYTGNNYLKGTGFAICPNDNSRVYLPPDGAEVYYKKSGTTDTKRILGFIVKGAVTTTLLTPGQRYDLSGNYGGKQVGGNNVLIRTGVSFLDSIHIITDKSYCPQ